jgi:hypothetical protein
LKQKGKLRKRKRRRQKNKREGNGNKKIKKMKREKIENNECFCFFSCCLVFSTLKLPEEKFLFFSFLLFSLEDYIFLLLLIQEEDFFSFIMFVVNISFVSPLFSHSFWFSNFQKMKFVFVFPLFFIFKNNSPIIFF